ncbi:copper-transporting ATPase PAA1, chloroplastic-like isoform X2 [Magnolia sinica]|uniref:copper-transporting ATPase PAA1, chloroplastic-like isoform X2 n=1 Tax=Magnolia sinica TaxID=86752 RepID=UPI0026592398|nr:copper-transporting ATPase PAA1, chloroplastic-like isoform X2 [Magnolia sinica]
MESAVLSIPIISSKTLKYNPNSLHRNHFKPSPNQTLTKSSIRSIVSSNSHRSREFFSMSFAAILPENPSATALISRQLASASSSARASASGGSGESKPVSDSSANEIILDVAGMMCDGCVKSVTRILESQPQVSSARVNLATETAVVCATPEAQVTQNWQQQVGETLANHLTNCGFKSNLRG